MEVKQILVSGIVFLIISELINTLASVATMGYYTDPAYFGLWSSLMMSTNGPPQSMFFAASGVFSLITGIIFAWAYSLLKKAVPGRGTRRGVNYGLMLFLIVGVPFSLTVYLLLAVPAGLLASWAFSSLIVYLIAGIAFSRILA